MKVITLGDFSDRYMFVLEDKDASTLLSLLGKAYLASISYTSEKLPYLLPAPHKININVADASIEKQLIQVSRLFPEQEPSELAIPLFKKHLQELNHE